MVEHALDARVAALVDGKCGEFGEVAAFRVAAHIYRHIAGQRRKHARHVCRGGFLRRNHRHVAQVEVFLPACDGAVGSAERQVGQRRAVLLAYGECARAELLLDDFGGLVCEQAHA